MRSSRLKYRSIARFAARLAALVTAALPVAAGAGCTPEQGLRRDALASETATTQGLASPRAADLFDGVAEGSASTTDAALLERLQEVDASRRNAIVQAAARVAPAVVSLRVISLQPVAVDPFFAPFFGPGQRQRASLGSGFLIDRDGIVITNEHVVRNAQEVMAILADGRNFEAEVLGADEVTDLAVLRIRGPDLPVAPIGSSEGLMIGEWALAIGNPSATYFSNTEPTVTAGVISAIDRHIIPSQGDRGFYLGMIQTDAAINPGNSGGPLVNALGEVVGVNSSIFSRSGGSEGLGFAIPIDRALRIAADLVEHGQVRRAWVGLDVEPADADRWGLTRGVVVSRVAEGSPAARAGLRTGDRLTRANGRRLATPLDFENVLLDVRVGDRITILRDGESSPLALEAAPSPTLSADRVTVLRDLAVVTLTPQIRAERGVAVERGALVVEISPQLTSQLGLQPGDVITQLNNQPVDDAEDVAGVLQSLQRGQRLRIYAFRNNGHVIRDLIVR